MRLPDDTDVLVIGAGIAGLATARALRELGCDALVIDRSTSPPAEATSRSAWMVRTDAEHPAIEALTVRGGELWRTGRYGTFEATGSFLIGRGDRDDVARHVPAARGRGEWRPADGLVDAESALAALAVPSDHLARRIDVVAIEAGDDGCVVRTSGGTVRARVVVNAAGAWAGVLGDLPLAPLKRHVFLSDAGTMPKGAPFAWDVEHGLYFRPHAAGLLFSACDEWPSPPGDATVEPRAVEEALAKIQSLQPGLGVSRVTDWWAGQRTFAPDRRFVIGWDPRKRGLFHVAALGGHGITVAPAVAELVAPRLVAGPDAGPAEVPDLSPARLVAP